ncbi:hypothetical protein MATR_18160 [Marivirga tractuosa]|uniref:Uncharacterized protein n=1 Tax=Marivirga tractuosa (strain ATCC 23168 / DSM 4126 / NBRC 15989 / NCIMB 1408 / VKM B-1430 / H-43) TaxID=643867 RepID=E4TQ04_MARTH|nr:hypothetical protein [Marivirga tractuosa]ADR20561.1 hypothetical protein Ftrac_0557 [Marivirga tractuosa DSM 4126]BDD14991.1 hypothetical protein MATR_18160 [Marivirga tractuosa]
MKVNFEKVKSDKIKNSFLEALSKFEDLHEYPITLYQKRVKSSTMQAQPIISLKNIFSGVKRYRIKLGVYVSSSERLKIEEVPQKVMTGWFAHELGHLIDYLSYSNFGMIKYGLQYVLSNSFKIKAEHEADYIAIKKGFRDEIIATKEWVLNHDLVGQRYKDRLNKYYLSIEQVELCNVNEPPFVPIIE